MAYSLIKVNENKQQHDLGMLFGQDACGRFNNAIPSIPHKLNLATIGDV